ncbi:MAG: GGDEF domain-containing protein [Candidatus Adiutrix sp.]|jgi:diguanylate cyclase (GGDEF)-like protein|nr:GGDEF domain-containing protein [Candidatus Adiutrix sp.]
MTDLKHNAPPPEPRPEDIAPAAAEAAAISAEATPEMVSCEVLMTMEVAILARRAPRAYQMCGLAPYFYTQLYPQEADGSHCDRPWLYSPLLEFFLEEAEEFFDSPASEGPDAVLSSGLWVEENAAGEEVPLTATARVLKSGQIIMIQAVREEYAERVRILRKARAELLERRKITSALSSFRKMALYDSLTKLYNRGAFMDILQNQISNLRTYAPNLALLMVDLDDFKAVNDELGHLAGDSVLSQIGELMRKSLRKNDAPVRYGGEEFAVIAPNTSLPQSLQVAEKLRRRVAEHDFGIGRTLTASIGCTIYRPGEDSRDFIARADLALYDAKHSGKNTVCQRDPWMPEVPGGPARKR